MYIIIGLYVILFCEEENVKKEEIIAKKIFGILLIVVLMFTGFATESLASSNESTEIKKLDNDLRELEKDYNFKVVDEKNLETSLDFENIEEFETFLQKLEETNAIETEENVVVSETMPLAFEKDFKNNTIGILSSNQKGSHLMNWWSPIILNRVQLGAHRNIRVNYTYKYVNSRPQYVSVDKTDSWLTGTVEFSWIHRGHQKPVSFSKKYSTKDTANLVVEGTNVLGIAIAGHPIGFSWNGTWKRSLTLVP